VNKPFLFSKRESPWGKRKRKKPLGNLEEQTSSGCQRPIGL